MSGHPPTEIDRDGQAHEAGRRNMARRTQHLGLDIGKRLKKARDLSGLTIAELAAKSHTTPRTIGLLIEGRGSSSSVGLLADVARALKVKPAWLCFGEGEGPKEETEE